MVIPEKNCKFDLVVFLQQFHLPGKEHLLEEIPYSYFLHYRTLSTMVQSISLDNIETAITGIRKSNKRPDCNVIHQYFKKKREIHLAENDVANKTSFLLEENILSKKCTSKGYSFYIPENVDVVEVAQDVVGFVDENVEDRYIINFNEECIAGPINSYLTAYPNSPESGDMEDNIAFIKAEILTLKSFVTDELYSLSQIMD